MKSWVDRCSWCGLWARAHWMGFLCISDRPGQIPSIKTSGATRALSCWDEFDNERLPHGGRLRPTKLKKQPERISALSGHHAMLALILAELTHCLPAWSPSPGWGSKNLLLTLDSIKRI